jgi:ATP-binding cassette subfamily F protein 3
MSLLVTEDLCKQYGAQEVLRRICLRVEEGDRIGLVGPNGVGKTTLLRLLAGLEEPTLGGVERKIGLRVSYLPQKPPPLEGVSLWEYARQAFREVLEMERELARLSEQLAHADGAPEALERFSALQAEFEVRGGYTYEARMKAVLAGLGFRAAQFAAPMGHFSGGERTRALLARLLLEEPELLLLDEPTNHLDLEAVEWLEAWLLECRHALLIVSHDRYLLDKVARRIWELDRGGLEHFRGNYTAYVRQREERCLERRRRWEGQQEYIARTEEFVRKYLAGQRTKEAQGRRAHLERFLATEAIAEPRGREAIHIRLDPGARGGERVLQTHGLAVGYAPSQPLLRVPDLEVWRGQRIAIVGPNGAGKTTLLRTLRGDLPPLEGRCRLGAGIQVAYLAQLQEDLEAEATVLDAFRAAAPELTGVEARTRLGAFLFRGDEVFKSVGSLSGGERSRLALARISVQNTNFLLLDEPTNHLDIPSQETLQEALREYAGTLLFVSHDRYLVQKLATHVWIICDGALARLEGRWDEYLEWRATRGTPAPSASAAKLHAENQRRAARRAAQRRQRELERLTARHQQLERDIAASEARLQELAAAITRAGEARQDDEVRRLGADYQAAEARLKQLWEEWTHVGEALERQC